MTDGGPLGIGIDVGGTKILAGVVSSGGNVVATARVPSPPGLDGLRAALDSAVRELFAGLPGEFARINSVALALPGLIEPGGTLRAAPNLGAADVGVALEEAFGRALRETLNRAGARVAAGNVLYENDATAAAFGEATVGAAAGQSEVLVIAFGTGIGAGLVVNHQVFRGGHGFAGEIGHMVIDPDGPPCPCGRRGCWERFASGPGLVYLAHQASEGGRSRDLRAEDIVEAARRGEPDALETVQRFARYVAIGLVNAIELLDPVKIVVGGGLFQASDILLEPVRAAYLAESRPAQQRRASDIVLATLGEDAAMIGSALIGLQHSANS